MRLFVPTACACALVLLLFLCTLGANGADVSQWKNRVIYQILTDRFSRGNGDNSPCPNLGNYCGGTYQGIIQHLDYLTTLGVDAIWITPIVENTPGGYHGYWLKNLYGLNENFGSAADLRSLISECHKRGIWVMLDVVANHVGPVGFDYSGINPFNQTSHYHPLCQIKDWNNQEQVEVCRLADLPDLDQSNSFVNNALVQWIKDVVSGYSFDGIRIDTVPEVAKSFWPAFAKSSGVYQLGEVFNGNVDYVAGYQQVLDGVFSYPLFFTLRGVFGSHNSMYGLQTVLRDQYPSAFKDLQALGTMLDNHDNARFLSFQSDPALYKAALTFTLMTQGIPVVYYGSEQGFSGGNDPNNRETLWSSNFDTSNQYFQHIRSLIAARKALGVATAPQVQRYADDQFYAFTRNQAFVATTNVGTGGGTVTRTITYHPYADGTKLCNWFNQGDCVMVASKQFTISLANGESKIYSPH